MAGQPLRRRELHQLLRSSSDEPVIVPVRRRGVGSKFMDISTVLTADCPAPEDLKRGDMFDIHKINWVTSDMVAVCITSALQGAARGYVYRIEQELYFTPKGATLAVLAVNAFNKPDEVERMNAEYLASDGAIEAEKLVLLLESSALIMAERQRYGKHKRTEIVK